MKTIKAWMRQTAANMAGGKSVWLGDDEWTALRVAGIVEYEEHDELVLSPLGQEIGAAERARQAMVKAKRNAAARGRSDALRSIGLVRTRYGWE